MRKDSEIVHTYNQGTFRGKATAGRSKEVLVVRIRDVGRVENAAYGRVLPLEEPKTGQDNGAMD